MERTFQIGVELGVARVISFSLSILEISLWLVGAGKREILMKNDLRTIFASSFPVPPKNQYRRWMVAMTSTKSIIVHQCTTPVFGRVLGWKRSHAHVKEGEWFGREIEVNLGVSRGKTSPG